MEGGGASGSVNDGFHYKPKSDDPGWKYALAKSSKEVMSIKCILCGHRSSGGITRLKEHLIGKRGDVMPCSGSTQEIRDEIMSYIQDKQQKKRENKKVQFALKGFFTNSDSPYEVCESMHMEIPTSQEGLLASRPSLPKGPMDTFLRQKDKGVAPTKQTTLENRYKKEEREVVCRIIGKWFYQAGIPFNAAKLPGFHAMVESIGQFGPGMKPPSYHELREPILEKEVIRTNEFIGKFKEYWVKFGCSIMSDGWTDRKERTLINFLVHCPQGIVFLKSVDASNKVKDAYLLCELFESIIKEVGEKNVIQIITDNAANYVKAGAMLMDKFPHLFWTPCAAHCIDLMLEDISKIKHLKSTFEKAKRLVVFIYNHGKALHMMRSFTNNRELYRPAVTRFATVFLTLKSIHDLKGSLRTMFISEEWRQSNLEVEFTQANLCRKTVLDTRFWKGVSNALRAMSPLVDALRLVDSDQKPAMGFIYEKMDRVKEQIKVNMKNVEAKYQPIWDIIDRRWDSKMHRPLHAAALYLNPGLYYDYEGIETSIEIKDRGLFVCISRLATSQIEEERIFDQLNNYRHAIGAFGMNMAIKKRKEYAPVDWWLTFGTGCPELLSFAIRILGLTCSASPCERNWSTFERIHTKKRNRLLHKKLNDLAFVQYNDKLQQRFEEYKIKGKSLDPIILSTVEDKDEWPTDDEFIDEDETLTWNDVAIASGAREKEGPHVRKRKNTQDEREKGKRRIEDIQEEDFNSDDTEEEEDDIEMADSSEDSQ